MWQQDSKQPQRVIRKMILNALGNRQEKEQHQHCTQRIEYDRFIFYKLRGLFHALYLMHISQTFIKNADEWHFNNGFEALLTAFIARTFVQSSTDILFTYVTSCRSLINNIQNESAEIPFSFIYGVLDSDRHRAAFSLFNKLRS